MNATTTRRVRHVAAIRFRRWPLQALAATLLLAGGLTGAADERSFRDDFASLDDWEPLTFPMIGRAHGAQGGSGSAGLGARAPANVQPLRDAGITIPLARGQRASGRGRHPEGRGRLPIRVYVFFPYSPDEAGWRMRAQYALARRLFGEDPPREARLAIMSHADNTGERAVGYLDWIVLEQED